MSPSLTLLFVVLLAVVSFLAPCHRAAAAQDWSSVDNALLFEISNHTFPGCVALVGNASGILYQCALGNFTYGLPAPASGTNPPMTTNTLFDLASLTKVIATTTAVMALYQHDMLSLSEQVSSERLLGSAYAVNGKQNITVLNLLLHNAGYPPDPVPAYFSKDFGCPATASYYADEVFTCQRKIFFALLNQTLAYPVGTQYVYSDLSFITLMYIVGKVARMDSLVSEQDLLPACISAFASGPWQDQCYYEAFIRTRIVRHFRLNTTVFLPPRTWWPNCAPTWNDTDADAPGPGYRHRVLQGQVSDQNAYALGGIAGHAGLFSTAAELFSLLHSLQFSSPSDPFINSTTVKLFTTVYNNSQSSRALGWDTNNYNSSDYLGCGNLSSASWTHTGYTGTEVCVDPDRELITVLLTNRVYPKADAESMAKIHWARQRFNNAVKAVVDGGVGGGSEQIVWEEEGARL